MQVNDRRRIKRGFKFTNHRSEFILYIVLQYFHTLTFQDKAATISCHSQTLKMLKHEVLQICQDK